MRRVLVIVMTLPVVAAIHSELRAQPFLFPISSGSFEGVPRSPITSPVVGTPPVAPHERTTLSNDTAALVAGNNRFALNIYQQLSSAAKPDENVLVSPFSISAALAMTYAGARGRTAQQMADVLGFKLPDDRLHPAFGALLSDLTTKRDGYQLSVANRLFGQAGYPFKNPFLNTTGRDYGAPLESADFGGNPDGSRHRINKWVAEQTNDKIEDLMPEGSVNSDMRLVLTNAIYFNGSWKHKFDSDATRDDTFFSAGSRQSQISLMSQQHSFLYAERPGFQMLEMPYAGDDLSMVVMLPTERDGLIGVEATLTAESLSESLDSLRSATVNVSLPKFTFESSFKLSTALIGMGMTDAFIPGVADFTGIGDEDLSIGAAFHNTFIAVNEEGTEAAAATAIGIVTTTTVYAPPQPKTFRADHPFLFALRDNHSGSLLFIGRVVDPGKLTAVSSSLVPESNSMVILLVGVVGLLQDRRTLLISRR